MPHQLPKTMLFVLAIAFACVSTNAHAGENKAGIKAAYELFDAMQMAKTYKKTIVEMVDVQIKQNPDIAPFRKVMLKFFEKYIGWNVIKGEMAKVYAKKFSVKELKELKKFYLTPLGKKAARLMPELTAIGAEMGQRLVMENMGELQRMIAEEAQRMGGQ